MSERSAVTAPTLRSSGAAPTLQRKCACGRSASQLIGDCPDCQREKQKLQKKLLVGSTDDPLEHEADRAAERVLSVPSGFKLMAGRSLPPLHPRPPHSDSAAARESHGIHESGRDPGGVSVRSAPSSAPVARAAVDAAPAGSSDVGSSGAARTAPPPRDVPAPEPAENEALTQGGAPLDPGLRGFFESRFGRDLSGVRLHSGIRSESLNERLNAHAFTYGNHIWLGRGHRPRADFLLAHELAHVIQQRQPERLRSPHADESAATSLSDAGPVVQRLSDEFWVPLGPTGKRTGADIHAEVQGVALANNGDLDIEAPAPNGSVNGSGLGLQGRSDFSLNKGPRGAHARVGLFFDGPVASPATTVPPGVPKRHANASSAGTFNPFVNKAGEIEGISLGPTSVDFGELKPASNPLLDKGKDQITHYRSGMEQASKLTNAWARKNNRPASEKWDLNRTGVLPDSAVKLVNNGVDMKFDPNNPREDQVLALGKIVEQAGGVGYTFRIIFNPALVGLTIRGGLYAQIARPGQGLWTYFARPKDLRATLATVRSIPKQREMETANLVQDQIIDPLFKTPEKKTPLLRDRTRTREAHTPPPVVRADATPVIRRAPKTPELKDDFKFTDWKGKHQTQHDTLFGAKATQVTKKNMAALELLEHAYNAEETLDKANVSHVPKTTLPAKSTDTVDIFSGKAPNKKLAKTRNLADMSSWFQVWTGKPGEVLGIFRDKFGDSFVVVANQFIHLRDRIHKKWKEAFDKQSKPGSSRGRIIAKALIKALHQVAKVLIPRAVHLFMDAVVAGSKKKLAKLFDVDPVKMAEDTFGSEFTELGTKLKTFKDDAEKHVDKIVDEYTKEFGWISDLLKAGSTIGHVLDAASAALLCGRKPGWNCLLLLSRYVRECGMEAALNMCEVQQEIAGLVQAIGPLANLPATLAQKGLDVAKDASPDALKEIFDEKVAGAGGFNSNEIECETSPSELKCPGLMPSPGKGGTEGPVDPEDKKEDERGEEEKRQPEPSTKGKEQPGKTEDKPDDAGEPTPGDQPKEDKPEGDKPQDEAPGDKPGAPKPDDKGTPQGQGGAGQGGGGQGTGQGAGGQGGGGQGGGALPKPNEVHEALVDLMDQVGQEGMGALAKLAEDAGMPGSTPLTLEQVKKLQELIKQGKLTPQDLQKLAEGHPRPGAKQRAKPLEKFLDTAAHDAALQDTLDKLRKKQFEFKFREMARLKVRWKIMVPYKPGPFRNAPALMTDGIIRAAGVVDGEFGKCFDGGKVELTITRADMHEEKTMTPVKVHTPFRDRSAQVAGGVCPTPPSPQGAKGRTKPKEPPGGQGQGGQGGGGKGGTGDKGGGKAEEGGAGEGKGGAGEEKGGAGEGKDDGGKGQDQGDAGEGAPPQGGKPDTPAEGEPGQAEAAEGEVEPGSEVNSGKSPRIKDSGRKDEGEKEDKDKDQKPEEEEKDTPGEKTYPLDVTGLAGTCVLPPTCVIDQWVVDFEEIEGDADGYQVMPAKEKDPDGTKSMLNPPNKLSPFSVRPATDGSTDQEMIITCEGKTCVVGRLQPSPVRAGMVELISGPLLHSLRSLLRQFLKDKRPGTTTRVERLHFF